MIIVLAWIATRDNQGRRIAAEAQATCSHFRSEEDLARMKAHAKAENESKIKGLSNFEVYAYPDSDRGSPMAHTRKIHYALCKPGKFRRLLTALGF